MKTFFNFLKSKTLFKHLAISLVLLFALLWGVFKWLSVYTHHGELVEVPNFTGIKIADLGDFVKDKKLKYSIIDSVYDPKGPKAIVIRQEPEEKINVKENRTIYLTVTTVLPPQVTMPKLMDKSLRQAASILESYGLKLGRAHYVPDQCANCVLQQLVKGKKVEPGAQLPKGTVVDLVVGKGLSGEKIPVPNLLGLNRAQVLESLAEYSLNEGVGSFEQPADSGKARVYRQIPGPSNKENINMGSSIDLFFTNKKEKFPQLVDSLKRD